MRGGRISTIIIFFFVGMTLYEVFVPLLPRFEWPHHYAFWRFIYYLFNYGILFCISFFLYRYVKHLSDKLALFVLCFYSIGKWFYFMFLINRAFPIYISFFHTKEVSIIVSFVLWFLAIIIWWRRFKIKQLLKFKLWD